MKLGISVARPNLVSLGTCLGKFSKSGKFKLHITSLDYLAQFAKYKVWIKPNGEMPFLYGNHILKAHLGRITEDTPEHQGVVIYSMNDVPLVNELRLCLIRRNLFQCLSVQGFGVTSRSTVDTRKLDPTAIVVFHQALPGMSGSTSVTSCLLLSMTSNEEDLCQKWIDLSDDHLESSTIDDTLGPIADDLWVVAAIADRVIDNSALLTYLLEVALKRSESTVERLRASFALQDDRETPDFGGQSPLFVDDDMVSYFSENPSDARMCLLRSLLLDRKDRLDTFTEMFATSVEAPVESDEPGWDDPWLDTVDTESEQQSEPGAPSLPLSTFLIQTLVESAHLLATRGSVGPLRVLFKRHGLALWPFRLSILTCIPDHVPPSLYQDILPKLDTSRDVEHQSHAETWRQEVDWTEHPRVQAALLTSGHATPKTQVPINQASRPMSSQELSTWYQQRAHSILTSTGMADTALLMVQHATSQDIPGLDELGEELILLSRLVYDAQAAANDGPEEDWTLEQWKSMDSLAVVRAMLALSTPESLIADIRKFVLPYLFVLESRAERAGNSSSGISLQLLSDFILGAPLEMVARIFEESKPTLLPGQRLISDDETMARLALACLYGSDSLGEWHVMSQIFECLPAWSATGDEDEDEVETTIASLGSFVTPTTARPKCTPSDLFLFFRPLPLPSLSRALDILDVHLESGEILSRWDAPAPLRWFLQSANDRSSQRARAVRMARQLGATHALRSRDDWEWLLEDMLKLSRTNDNGLRSAFGLLSQADILKLQIAEGLLRSKKSTLSLDDRAVEDICLTSSREFYDNASSGNYTFGEMKLAYDCLSIPSRSERVIREQEFIEATSRITSFNVESRPGVPLTPIEIRLTKDRLSLISRVLSSNSDGYKYKEVILELVDKLGFRGDVVARAKTLAMIADTALQAEDFAQAFETSEAMINTVSQLCLSPDVPEEQLRDAKEVCWVSCFQLGRQTEFPDVPKKLRLLGHALEFCPADRLPEILAAWRRLEKEDIAAQHQHTS
ncbi:secretory pathway protein Sec39-domain-containing protein [Lactarius deliciosus]|nr:secretory pathway protein Sec39-domain-containing protein [Lactarius deliciosus]